MTGTKHPHWARHAALAAVVLLLWQVVGSTHFGLIWSSPAEVSRHLLYARALYAHRSFETLCNAATGLAAGALSGFVLAALRELIPPLSRLFSSLSLFAAMIPVIGVVKLLTNSTVPDMAATGTAALLTFYPVYIMAEVGLKSCTAGQLNLFRSSGAGQISLFWRLKLPAAVPYLVHSVRLAIVAAILGAMLGEYAGGSSETRRGLGSLLTVAIQSADASSRLAITLIIVVASVVLFYLVGLLSDGLASQGYLLDRERAMLADPALTEAAPTAWAGVLRHRALRAFKSIGVVTVEIVAMACILDIAWRIFGPESNDDSLLTLFRQLDVERSTIINGGLGKSFAYALLGLFAGLTVATGLSIFFFYLPNMRAIVQPLLLVFQLTPMVAFVPVIVGFAGRGRLAVTLVVTSAVLYRLFEIMDLGLNRAPKDMIDYFHTSGASRRDELWHLRFPLLLKMTSAAITAGAPMAIQGVILAEYLLTDSGGIGRAFYNNSSRTSVIVSLCLLTMGMSYAVTGLATAVSSITLKRVEVMRDRE